MSVKATHSQYDDFEEKWERCRAAAAGQDAVHAAGEEFLPRLKDQETKDYEAYVKRANFFGATWRTITGLSGMIFRKPPLIEVPAVTEMLLDDVTLDGMPFSLLSLLVVQEALTVGRLGLLVDYPKVDVAQATQADAAKLNLRPTLTIWKAENILNWKTRRVNNKTVLSRVVLKETRWEDKNEFETEAKDYYRVLDLEDGSNLYRVRVFRIEHEVDILVEGPYMPLVNGAPLNNIPFYFIGVDGVEVEVDEPPLIDLIDLNLSHYRTTADYEHGCHFTGLPTAVVSGHVMDNQNEKLYIGSTTAWVFPHPQATAKYLEFTGQGLGELEKNLKRKEAQMALLGARMLEDEKKGVESAIAASIHRSGEHSTLAMMANAISLGLTMALQMFSDWAGGMTKVSVRLNRDFVPTTMDAATLTSLVSAWQQGAISQQELFENLQKGELISDAVKFDDHAAQVANDVAAAQAQNLKDMQAQAAIQASFTPGQGGA